MLHRKDAFSRVYFCKDRENEAPPLNTQQPELYFCFALYLPVLKTAQPDPLCGLRHTGCKAVQDLYVIHCFGTAAQAPGPGFASLFLQLTGATRFGLKGSRQETKEELSMVAGGLQSLVVWQDEPL